MELLDLTEILADQKADFLGEDCASYCDRLESKMLSSESKLAQVVIGVRRSGKSTLCTQYLRNHNINCGYINFDDERLYNLKTEDLNKALKAIYILYGQVDTLFFDEIQNVEAWPLFINRLLRQNKHIFLTGSNSKLLSNELMTHLTGRSNKVELYPFSFSEFCRMKDVDTVSITTKAAGLRQHALHEYISNGGMPELLNESNKKGYITGLFNAIIYNDISKRFKVKYVDSLYKMAQLLANNFSQEYSPSSISKLLGISNHTVDKYYQYLKEAFLLIGIPKFSFKVKERNRMEKCYVIDISFATELENTFSLENLGWKLENAVCIELMRRYHHLYAEVFFYKEKSFEVDFVIAGGGKVKELIQVSYDISSEKTMKREIQGLITGAKKLNCKNLTLISFSDKKKMSVEGYEINVIPAVDWFLEANSEK